MNIIDDNPYEVLDEGNTKVLITKDNHLAFR